MAMSENKNEKFGHKKFHKFFMKVVITKDDFHVQNRLSQRQF